MEFFQRICAREPVKGLGDRDHIHTGVRELDLRRCALYDLNLCVGNAFVVSIVVVLALRVAMQQRFNTGSTYEATFDEELDAWPPQAPTQPRCYSRAQL